MVRFRRPPSFHDYLYEACGRLESIGGFARVETTEALANELVLLKAGVIYEAQDVELSVFEVVRKTSKGAAHRDRYCYSCWLESHPVFRYERDPDQHPEMPDHMHLPGVAGRVPGTVDLHPMLDELWERIDDEKHRRAAVSAQSA
jgi:hypothetical protein